MNVLNYDTICQMILGAVSEIRTHSDELSLLDAEVGDGDHGVTMRRAMEKIAAVMAGHPDQSISNLLSDIAWALLAIDGGATGPLFGSLFLGMADATEGKTSLTIQEMVEMFAGGLASLQEQSKAKLGDKTLMDAIIPAVDALRQNPIQGDILAALKAAATAARNGSNSTVNLVAHFGRAKFQGERTLGKLDPGSVSMALFFEGMLHGLEHRVRDSISPDA